MLLMAGLSLLDSMISMPFTQTLLNFSTGLDKFQARTRSAFYAKKIAKSYLLAIALPALLITIALLLSGAISTRHASFIGLLGIAPAIEVLRASIIACFHNEQSYQKISAWLVLDAAIMLSAVLGSICAFGSSSLSFIFGYTASRFVGLIVAIGLISDITFFSKRLYGLPPQEERAAISFALPIAAMGPIGWASVYLDRVTLGMIETTTAVGHYSAAGSLVARPFAISTNILTTVFRPRLVAEIAKQDYFPRSGTTVAKVWIFCTLLAGLTAYCCYFAFGRYAVDYFLGVSFRRTAVDLIPIMIASQTILIFTHAIDNIYFAMRLTRQLLTIQTLLLPISTLLLSVFIFNWGILGAAFSRVGFEAVKAFTLLIILHISVRRRSSVEASPSL
jgi:O-antigen/teichoic acid export membrane protein